jgi:hypothetical protein
MDHDLFGDLQHDPANDEWTGSVALPRFAAFGEPTFDDDADRRRQGILPLVVRDPTGTGPSPQQERAFRFLRDHEGDVFRAALDALFESYQEYTASPLSGLWERVGRWFGVKPVESPSGLAGVAAFTGVEVARPYKNDAAYLLFAVNCGWEPEHGMVIVYHQDRPATWTTIDALELDADGGDE